MKRILWVSFVLLCPVGFVAAQEQSPLSVSAMAFLGPNGTRSTGHSFQLNADYYRNRFSIGTGIAYFSSGFENESILMLPLNQYPNTAYEEYTFQHLMVPLTLSYHAPIGQRMELIPSAGLGASYNTGARYRTQSSDSSYYKRDFSSTEFDRYFRRISIWGNAAIHFSYKLGEQTSLLAGIALQGMLTGIYKSGVDVPGQHNATLYFGLGMRYRFY